MKFKGMTYAVKISDMQFKIQFEGQEDRDWGETGYFDGIVLRINRLF